MGPTNSVNANDLASSWNSFWEIYPKACSHQKMPWWKGKNGEILCQKCQADVTISHRSEIGLARSWVFFSFRADVVSSCGNRLVVLVQAGSTRESDRTRDFPLLSGLSLSLTGCKPAEAVRSLQRHWTMRKLSHCLPSSWLNMIKGAHMPCFVPVLNLCARYRMKGTS